MLKNKNTILIRVFKVLNKPSFLHFSKKLGLFILFLLIGFILKLNISSAAVADGVYFYTTSSNTTPQYRDYTQSTHTMTAAGNTVTGTQGTITQIKASPTAQEMIAGYVDTAGNVQIMCYDGTTWSNEWSDSVAGTGVTRRFDIAYETSTGDVLVLYSNNGATTTNELSYRTKSGSTGCGSANWSAESNFDPVRTSGTAYWIKLKRNPISSSSLIAASWLDSAGDLSAAIWNGSSFTNEPSAVLDAAVERFSADGDTDSFGLEYESLSGDLMIVWGRNVSNNTNGSYYATCTGGTSGCSWTSAAVITGTGDRNLWMELASNPETDEIAFNAIGEAGTSDDGSGGYWSGSAWTAYSLDATSENMTAAGQQAVATAWAVDGSNDVWIANYDDASGTALSWYQATNAGTPSRQTDFTTSPTINDIRHRYQSYTNPLDHTKGILLLSDATTALTGTDFSLSGTTITWNNVTNNGANTSYGTPHAVPQQGFSFAYWIVTNKTVGGEIYDNGGSAYNCSGNTLTVRAKINGAGDYTADCTSAGGTYSLSLPVVNGSVITIFLDGETENASTVYKYGTTCPTTCADLYQNTLSVIEDASGSATNTDLDYYDEGNDGSSGDLGFTVSSGNITVSNGWRLRVYSAGGSVSTSYAPGGTITTDPSSDGTDSNLDGDLTVDSSATLSMSTNALSVGGDLALTGTFSYSASQTTTLTATASGHSADDGSNDLHNLTLNGSGGEWTLGSAVTLAGDLTVTAGTLLGTQNVTISGGDVSGNGTINLTGGTFTLSGTPGANFGGNTTWVFDSLTIGGATNTTYTATGTGSITVNETLTIDSGDTLNAGSKTWTLTDSDGCPCSPFVKTGTYTSSAETFVYSGGAATTVASATYYNLSVIPGADSITHTLPSSLTVTNNLVFGGTNTATITASTNNTSITLNGNLTLANNTTFTKGTGTLTLSPSGTKTITDSNSTKQDLGNVSISGGSATPRIGLASNVKVSTMSVASSHTLCLASDCSSGSNTLTLTAGSGDLTGDSWCSDVSGVTCDTGWLYRKKITFDNTASAGALTNFPVLIQLTSSNIDFAKVEANGADLRFVDPADNTTVLDHEIESWNEAGTSYVWVRVPSLAATSSDYVWMYYGKSGASDGQNATGVWDSNYKGVWHLNETVNDEGTTVDAYTDATSNTNDGDQSGPDDAAGKFGNGQVFVGDNVGATDHINANSNAAIDDFTQKTISMWVKRNVSTLISNNLAGKASAGAGWNMEIRRSGGSSGGNKVRFADSWSSAPGGLALWHGSTDITTDTAWYYITVTYDNSSTANDPVIYINGVADTITEVQTPSGTLQSDGGSNLGFGEDLTFGGQPHDGMIDEIRYSNTIRSADWVEAEYLFAVDDSKYTFGSELTQSAPVFTVTGTFTPNTGTVEYTGTNAGGNVSITDTTYYNLSVNNGSETFDAPTNLTVSGNLTITAGTFTAPSGNLTLSGNFSDSGTFTHNSGEIIFNGAGTSEIDGNSTVFFDFTSTTAGKALRFKQGETVRINGLLTLTGADGNNITLDSIDGSTQWTIYHSDSPAATENVTYTTVTRGACDASSTTITMSTGTTNGGSNGTCWGFAAAITVSGSYLAYDQSANGTDSLTVKVAFGSTLQGQSTTTSGGAFTITGVTAPSAGAIVTVFIDGGTDSQEAVAVTEYDGTGNISGLLLYAEHLTIGSDDTPATITNSDLANYDNEASGDEDIFYESDTVAFTCNNTASFTGLCTDVGTGQSTQDRLYIKTGWTFTPGSDVMTSRLDIRGTYSGSTETLSLTGTGTSTTCGDASQMPVCVNGGTFTIPATVNYTGDNVTATVYAATTYTNLGIGTTQDSGTGSTFTLGGNTTVSGTLTLGNGSSTNTDSLDASSYTLTLSGSGTPLSITAKGNLTESTSTVNYTGTSATNITAETYNNLGVGTTADGNTVTFTLAGNITVGGVLTVGAGSGSTHTLDASSRTITLSGSGTPFVIATGGAFTESTSTVNYTGTSATNITADTYNNLGVGRTADANSVTYTLAGNTTVAGVLTIGDSGSGDVDFLDASSITLTLSGTGTPIVLSSGLGRFTASTSTVVYSGSSTTALADAAMTGASAFYNLTINSSGTITAGVAAEVKNDLTVTTGILAMGANNLTVGNSGNASSGSIKVAASHSLTQSSSATTTILSSAAGSNCIGSSGASCTGTSGTITLGNLTIGNSSTSFTTTIGGTSTLTISNDLTVTANATFDGGSNGTIILNDTGTPFAAVAGTFTANASTVRYTGSSAGVNILNTTYYNLELKPGGTQTYTLGTAGSQTITVNGDLIVGDDTNSVTVDWTTYDPGLTVKGNITLYDPSVWTKSDTATLTLSPSGTKNINDQNSGKSDLGIISLTGGSSTPKIALSTNSIATSFTIDTGHEFDLGSSTLTLTKSSDAPFVITGTFTPSTGTIEFAPTSSSTVNIASGTYNHVIFNSTSSTFRLASGALTTGEGGNITLTAGELDTVFGTNSALNIGGSFLATSGTFQPRAGTVTFTATATGKTIAPTDFYNVVFNGTGGGWSFSNTTTINNSLTITAGTLSGTSDITVSGNVTGTNGIITLTGGTLEQRVTANQNFGTTSGSSNWTFNNLTFSRSGGTPTITTQTGGSGTLTITGNLLVSKTGDGAGTVLDAGNRTWILSNSNGSNPFDVDQASGSCTCSSANFQFTGDNDAGSVTVENGTYATLTFGGAVAETYAPEGALVTSGTITINANGTLSAPASISVGGDWANSGTFTHNSGAVTFTATSGTKAINNNSSQFYDVVINGSGGTFQPNTNAIIIANDLTCTAGTLSGTLGITVNGGDVAGDCSINMTGGTFLVDGDTSTGFGSSGGTAWSFYNLTFGDGTGTSDTTTNGSNTITVSNVLTIAANHSLTNESLNFTLSGSGTPLVRTGNLTNDPTTTFTYTSGSGVTALSSAVMTGINAFGNLVINGSGTFTAGIDFDIKSDLTVTSGTLAGSPNVIAYGVVSGAGTINLSGGTFTHSTTTNKGFGSNSAWTFNSLTLSGSSGTTAASGSGSITISDRLTIDTGHTLTAGSKTYTLSGTSGTVFTVSGVFTADTSTISYTGNNGSGPTTVNPTTYYNLTINNGSETFESSGGSLSILNDLNITNGVLDLNTNDPTTNIVGTLTIGGTLEAPANMTLNGDMINNGTFNANSGSVVLEPSDYTTSITGGPTNFHNITASNQGKKTIAFQALNTYGISGLVTMSGDGTNSLRLVSDTPGSQWTLNFTGTHNLDYLYVQDVACSGNSISGLGENVINGGNNDLNCWVFRGRSGGSTGASLGSPGGGAGSGGGAEGGAGGGAEGGAGGGAGSGGGAEGGAGGGVSP